MPKVAFAVKKVVFYSLFNRQAGSMACVSAIVAAIKIQKAALKAAFCPKFKLMEDRDEDATKGEKVVFSTHGTVLVNTDGLLLVYFYFWKNSKPPKTKGKGSLSDKKSLC